MPGIYAGEGKDFGFIPVRKFALPALAADPDIGDIPNGAPAIFYHTGLKVIRLLSDGEFISIGAAGDAEPLDPEAVQDIVGAMLGTQSGITVTYDDATNVITFAVTDSPLLGGETKAAIRDRSTHTGTQSQSTITGLVDALTAKLDAAQKGANNGVATLDSQGKVPYAQMPSIVITDVHVVANIAERDALAVESGDVAIVLDNGSERAETHIYDGTQWRVLPTPTDGVSAVTGAAPITSTGGTTPELGLAEDGVTSFHLAPEAVGEEHIESGLLDFILMAVRQVDGPIGDGVATSIPVTHGLNNRRVSVTLFRNSSPWEEVECDVEHTDANTVTLKFAIAPTTNQFIVVVQGQYIVPE